jgi:acetate---CoA ligase (ADP-forming)
VIDKGAKFGVMFAAGFAEVGEEGEQLQSELEELLAASDLRLLGPNTNLNAFETFTEGLPGKAIALITQSGHQGRPVFQSQQLGIRLSHWAPTGNEADLEFADFAVHFADLDEVGVMAGYIEGFKDGRTLMLAADHAAQRGRAARAREGRSH